jgi:hypothetical protein
VSISACKLQVLVHDATLNYNRWVSLSFTVAPDDNGTGGFEYTNPVTELTCRRIPGLAAHRTATSWMGEASASASRCTTRSGPGARSRVGAASTNRCRIISSTDRLLSTRDSRCGRAGTTNGAPMSRGPTWRWLGIAPRAVHNAAGTGSSSRSSPVMLHGLPKGSTYSRSFARRVEQRQRALARAPLIHRHIVEAGDAQSDAVGEGEWWTERTRVGNRSSASCATFTAARAA